MGVLVGTSSLLAVCLLARRPLDPLDLGRAGRVLPAALVLCVASSVWASPVPRAGAVALVLLPAFLLLPDAVESCLEGNGARRHGLVALVTVVLGVAVWSLVDAALSRSLRTAMPLGQHGLLARWVVLFLPLGFLPVAWGGWWRWYGLGVGSLALGAIVATGSLAAWAGIAAQVVLLVLLVGGRGRWLLAIPVLWGALQGPRLWQLLQGEDPSALARLSYLQAGWRGFLERPVLGWGPGSVPWTLAEHSRPPPGVSPPSEVVSDLHVLPLSLLYEIGLPGALIGAAIVVTFLVRLALARGTAADPALRLATLLGLAGGIVSSLGGSFLAVSALPLALATLAGLGLASCGSGNRPRRPPLAQSAYVVGAALLLVRPLLAHSFYEQARGGDPRPGPVRALRELRLERAVELDARFPLYRFRLALGQGSGPGPAHAALEAARQARGLAPLWLLAGRLGAESGEPWASLALERACELDPLSGVPPFLLAVLDPSAPDSVDLAARAVLAEPRLAAARFWEREKDLFVSLRRRVEEWPGVEAGWKVAFLERTAGLPLPPGPTASLSLELDTVPATSFSLYAFRRSPWPARIVEIALHAEAASRLDLPAPFSLPTTDPDAVPRGCGRGAISPMGRSR